MPKNVLISSLGDHPAVVTGMVKALRHQQEPLEIDELLVLHTVGSGKLIRLGCDLIEETLHHRCQVKFQPLSFHQSIADPNTLDESIEFLRTLASILEGYEASNDTVCISLVGGRKNISALMAVICQFFPCVKGLFHLITRSEGAFPSIEQLAEMPENKRLSIMEPSLEQMTLVRIPYQTFVDGVERRRYFSQIDHWDGSYVRTTPLADSFFKAIFQSNRPYTLLRVYFNRHAWEEARELVRGGGVRAENFLTCFEQMQDPVLLKSRLHGSYDKYSFYKRPNTAERPFFYTEPNPIHLFPRKHVSQVVICGLSVEQDNGNYTPTMDELIDRNNFEPYKSLAELNRNELILLIPLGESPMVASQTYTLLQMHNREWNPQNIASLAVIYPAQNGLIKRGVRVLEKAFKHKYPKLKFQAFTVDSLDDLDSYEKCEQYLRAILQTIEKLQQDNPDKQIVLSLSGGRKGMSALTLFAAQRVGIRQVYHTTITDADLEQQITQETQVDVLRRLSRNELVQHLFLEKYDIQKFTLFMIPVIQLV